MTFTFQRWIVPGLYQDSEIPVETQRCQRLCKIHTVTQISFQRKAMAAKTLKFPNISCYWDGMEHCFVTSRDNRANASAWYEYVPYFLNFISRFRDWSLFVGLFSKEGSNLSEQLPWDSWEKKWNVNFWPPNYPPFVPLQMLCSEYLGWIYWGSPVAKVVRKLERFFETDISRCYFVIYDYLFLASVYP